MTPLSACVQDSLGMTCPSSGQRMAVGFWRNVLPVFSAIFLLPGEMVSISSRSKMANQPITIIGGGLAGLTLGIGLRQRGIPVTIWEAGRYPRHKACGEFVSGQGQEVLRRMGLLMELREAGMCEASTAMFLTGKVQGPRRTLHPPALCLSRFTMDALLARYFQACGGDLREQQRWQGELSDGMVRASGRRAQPTQNGRLWFGL